MSFVYSYAEIWHNVLKRVPKGLRGERLKTQLKDELIQLFSFYPDIEKVA